MLLPLPFLHLGLPDLRPNRRRIALSDIRDDTDYSHDGEHPSTGPEPPDPHAPPSNSTPRPGERLAKPPSTGLTYEQRLLVRDLWRRSGRLHLARQ
ncbi:MAG: hypothetical protein K2W96_07015 [Gemmataceae bacterium]|nr:hypothetical protein [Gemmataceae bacterium]